MKAIYLGRRPYFEVLALQTALFNAKARQRTAQRLAAGHAVASGGLLPPSAAAAAGSPPLQSVYPDVLLLVEHAHGIYTMGRRDTSEGMTPHGEAAGGSASGTAGERTAIGEKRAVGWKYVTSDAEAAVVAASGDMPVARIRRGGGITWHGPGQLTIYPIVAVQELWVRCTLPTTSTAQGGKKSPPSPAVGVDGGLEGPALKVKGTSPLRWYTSVLEESMLEVLRSYGVAAVADATVGLWTLRKVAQPSGSALVADRKIASIGIQVSNWVSMHGAALNISNDVAAFDRIVMCELEGKRATTVAEELAFQQQRRSDGTNSSAPLVPEVALRYAEVFGKTLQQPTGSPDLAWWSSEDEMKRAFGITAL